MNGEYRAAASVRHDRENLSCPIDMPHVINGVPGDPTAGPSPVAARCGAFESELALHPKPTGITLACVVAGDGGQLNARQMASAAWKASRSCSLRPPRPRVVLGARPWTRLLRGISPAVHFDATLLTGGGFCTGLEYRALRALAAPRPLGSAGGRSCTAHGRAR